MLIGKIPKTTLEIEICHRSSVFSVFSNSLMSLSLSHLVGGDLCLCVCMQACGLNCGRMAMHDTSRRLPSFETNVIIMRG